MPVIRLATGLCLIGTMLGSASLVAEDVETEERIIEHQLDATQSGVLRNSPRPIEGSQVERDLSASEQRLRSFSTRQPGAESIPLFERQLDRSSRPARIGAPPAPPLLGGSGRSSGLR
jgi:hypothetical protein